jgi:hypothetical protein
MLVKFLRDSVQPHAVNRLLSEEAAKKEAMFDEMRAGSNPDFIAGKIYDLNDSLARFFIDRGRAEQAKIKLKASKPSITGKARIVHAPNTINPRTGQVWTAPELLTALGLQTQPQPRINLTVQDQEALKNLRNKQLVNDAKDYFAGKTIPVERISAMLIILFEHAIDIKDDKLIAKIAGDLLTLKRLTGFYYEK